MKKKGRKLKIIQKMNSHQTSSLRVELWVIFVSSFEERHHEISKVHCNWVCLNCSQMHGSAETITHYPTELYVAIWLMKVVWELMCLLSGHFPIYFPWAVYLLFWIPNAWWAAHPSVILHNEPLWHPFTHYFEIAIKRHAFNVWWYNDAYRLISLVLGSL